MYSLHRTYEDDCLRFEVTEEGAKEWRKWRNAQASVIYPEGKEGTQRVKLIEDHWTSVKGGKIRERTIVYVKTVPSVLQEPIFEDLDFPEFNIKYTEAYKASIMSYTEKELFMEEDLMNGNIGDRLQRIFMRCFGRMKRERQRGECNPNPIGRCIESALVPCGCPSFCFSNVSSPLLLCLQPFLCTTKLCTLSV